VSYCLYRLDAPGDAFQDGAFLGVFDTFDEALTARDDDTAALSAVISLVCGASQDDGLLACHQIVGPGVAGPHTAHPVITSVEAAAADHAELLGWLRAIHQPTGQSDGD
jgi:hypothetical protein